MSSQSFTEPPRFGLGWAGGWRDPISPHSSRLSPIPLVEFSFSPKPFSPSKIQASGPTFREEVLSFCPLRLPFNLFISNQSVKLSFEENVQCQVMCVHTEPYILKYYSGICCIFEII